MAAKNTIVRTMAERSLAPSAKNLHLSTTSYNQGDLLVLDTSTHALKVQAIEADSAKFMGVAKETVVNGKVKQVYTTDVDASVAISDLPGPCIGVVSKCILKTGDSLNPGNKVGLDPATGSRGVTATIVTESVGVYNGPAIVTAAAGTEIEVTFEKYGSALLS